MDNENREMFQKILERFDSIDSRLDKMDGRLDKMDDHLKKVDDRLDKMDDHLKKVDTRLDIIEHKQDRTAKQLEDLQINVAVAQRSIRRDIFELKDEMETVIQVLKMHELIP